MVGGAAASLDGRHWRLQRANGEVIAERLVLHPGGRMGLHRRRPEWRWSADGGVLRFHDWHGQVSVVFDWFGHEDGRAVFNGTSRYDDQPHLLVEIEPLSSLADDDGSLQLIGTRGGDRRNLVVLRADEASLHMRWPGAQERSWDLCVSFYGEPRNFPPADFADFHVLQHQDRKFTAIHKLLHRRSVLWDYDFVMFPDDDLMLSWSDLDTLFEICREHRLELAQPALASGSFHGQPITLQQPRTLLRYTSYVETMAPIFSIEALRLCLPTFALSRVGWGLDFVWPWLLGAQASRVAIIDAVAVRHTRPVATTYVRQEAEAELDAQCRLYGVTHRFIEYGRLNLT